MSAGSERLLRRDAPLRFKVSVALSGLLDPIWVFFDVARRGTSYVGVGVPITILAFAYLLCSGVRRPRPQEIGGSGDEPPGTEGGEVGRESSGRLGSATAQEAERPPAR